MQKIKKFLIPFIVISVLFFTCLDSKVTVAAGSINLQEAELLSYLEGTFEVDGVEYQATDTCKQKVRNYVQQDGCDLTSAEKEEYIEEFQNNLGEGIRQGYLVPIDSSESEDEQAAGSTESNSDETQEETTKSEESTSESQEQSTEVLEESSETEDGQSSNKEESSKDTDGENDMTEENSSDVTEQEGTMIKETGFKRRGIIIIGILYGIVFILTVVLSIRRSDRGIQEE